MKTKLGLLLVMLSLAVWCDDSTDAEQPTDPKVVYKQPPRSLQRGLVAYYPFNGNAKDESGNGHDGNAGTDLVTIKDRHGVPGRAISTGDSVDGRISWRGYFVENVFSGKTSISISMWVQPLKQVDKNSMVFLEYQGGNLSPPGYLSLLSLSAYDLSAMQFHKNNMGDNSQLFEIPINEWAFMTVVTTATDCKGYVDGVCRYKSPIVGALQSGKSPSLSLGGRVSWPGSVPAQYNRINAHAGFDELRIYNRALSAAEVKSLYKYESKLPVKTGNNLLRKLAHFLRP